jgi:hypothetical protein
LKEAGQGHTRHELSILVHGSGPALPAPIETGRQVRALLASAAEVVVVTINKVGFPSPPLDDPTPPEARQIRFVLCMGMLETYPSPPRPPN